MKAGSRISSSAATLNPQALRMQKQVSTNYHAYNAMSKETLVRLVRNSTKISQSEEAIAKESKETILMTLLENIHGSRAMELYSQAGGLLSKKELGL